MIPKYMIMNEVSRQLDMPPSEIICRSRKLKYRNARVILWAALREAGYSYPAIGSYTGRDHSTVNVLLKTCEPAYRDRGKEIYDRVAMQQVDDRLEKYPDLYDVVTIKVPDYHKNIVVEKQVVVKKL